MAIAIFERDERGQKLLFPLIYLHFFPKIFLILYLRPGRGHDEHGLLEKDTLDDILPAALSDEEPDSGVSQHGTLREGAVFRDVDVLRHVVLVEWQR